MFRNFVKRIKRRLLKYGFFSFFGDLIFLHKKGYKRIKKVQKVKWNRNICRYYLAFRKTNKFFIKVVKPKEQIIKELEISQKIIKEGFSFVLEPFDYFEKKGFGYLVLPYMNKYFPIWNYGVSFERNRFFQELYNILVHLESLNIVHADINFDNCLIYENRIILIDFGNAMNIGEERICYNQSVAYPGYFKDVECTNSSKIITYDDAKAVSLMLDLSSGTSIFEKKIIGRIGRCTASITIYYDKQRKE